MTSQYVALGFWCHLLEKKQYCWAQLFNNWHVIWTAWTNGHLFQPVKFADVKAHNQNPHPYSFVGTPVAFTFFCRHPNGLSRNPTTPQKMKMQHKGLNTVLGTNFGHINFGSLETFLGLTNFGSPTLFGRFQCAGEFSDQHKFRFKLGFDPINQNYSTVLQYYKLQ